MRRLTFLFALMTLVGAPISAQWVGIERPEVIERWMSELDQADIILKNGDWKAGQRSVEGILKEMCRRIEGGESVENLLAYGTFLRAIAEAGHGNVDLARWDYQTSQTLVPAIAEVDLTAYGEAGALLVAQREAEGESFGEAEEEGEQEAEKQPVDPSKITPPKALSSQIPKYPFAKVLACLDGPIVVQVFIDERGVPTRPRLMTPQEPLLSFAALEAMRGARFEPARIDGEPIGSYLNRTVNFKLNQQNTCNNPVAKAVRAKQRKRQN